MPCFTMLASLSGTGRTVQAMMGMLALLFQVGWVVNMGGDSHGAFPTSCHEPASGPDSTSPSDSTTHPRVGVSTMDGGPLSSVKLPVMPGTGVQLSLSALVRSRVYWGSQFAVLGTTQLVN